MSENDEKLIGIKAIPAKIMFNIQHKQQDK